MAVPVDRVPGWSGRISEVLAGPLRADRSRSLDHQARAQGTGPRLGAERGGVTVQPNERFGTSVTQQRWFFLPDSDARVVPSGPSVRGVPQCSQPPAACASKVESMRS
jgi:hypothetical protein